MKKQRIAIGMILTMMLTLLFSATTVLADDPAGVVRSGTIDDFAKNAPIGTISIDTSQMVPSTADITTTGDLGFDDSEGERTSLCIVWAPNGVIDREAVSISKGETVSANGSATLTWPGIATLQDGSTADVTMIITNVFLDKPLKNIMDGETVVGSEDTDAHGPIAIFRNGGWIGPQLESRVYEGLSLDIEVQITQDGTPVNGQVLFSTWDLDVIDNVHYNNTYPEGFTIVDGAVSAAYIPESNFCGIERSGSASSANGVKFYATKGDNNTYNTGFVVLTDASSFKLNWQGQGNGMGTQLFTGNISHAIDSTTTKGGSIKTTTTGKAPGSDGAGDELGPVHVDVPDGKDVSYLMEPEDGYELAKILVDGEEIDPEDSSTWPSFIEVTKDANGNPIVTFKENAANHTIDVSWDPIVTATSGTGGSISDPGDKTVPFGSGKRYTFTPEDGYTIGTVTVNGEEVEPQYDAETGTWYYDLENIEDPTTIDVQWKKTYTVTFEDGENGTSAGGDQTDVPEGDYPKGGNRVTPNKGYQFSGTYKYVITKEDGTTEEGETDDPTSVPVTGDIVFTPKYDPVVTATSGSGGSISDPGDTTVENGGSKTYTFTPEPGFEPDKVTVNGKEVTPVDNGDGTWSYTVENVTEPTTIDVQWKKIQVPVTFIDPLTGETIDAQSVSVGDKPTDPSSKAPVHPGYTFKGWDTTLDPVTGAMVIKAIYEPNQYTIKYDANGGSGTMTDQKFTGADKEAVSKANTFTREGYEFVGFKAKLPDGSSLKDENGKDLIFTDPADFIEYLKELGDGSEITLEAQWKKITPIKALKNKIRGEKKTLTPAKTGDASQTSLYFVLFAAALTACVTFGVSRRKRK